MSSSKLPRLRYQPFFLALLPSNTVLWRWWLAESFGPATRAQSLVSGAQRWDSYWLVHKHCPLRPLMRSDNADCEDAALSVGHLRPVGIFPSHPPLLPSLLQCLSGPYSSSKQLHTMAMMSKYDTAHLQTVCKTRHGGRAILYVPSDKMQKLKKKTMLVIKNEIVAK